MGIFTANIPFITLICYRKTATLLMVDIRATMRKNDGPVGVKGSLQQIT